MITFVGQHLGQHRHYLAGWGAPVAGRVRAVTYSELRTGPRPVGETVVFTDLVSLSPWGRARASRLFDALRAAEVPARVLNDPRRVLGRYDLLREMRARGVNDHTAHRLRALHRTRFPVFIRRERDHAGPLTGLAHSRAELLDHLRELVHRGERLAGLVAVEFADTVEEDGGYSRHRAFKVGDRIIPRSLRFDRDWVVKGRSAALPPTPDQLARELRYVEENPHERWLREVFRIANVDYGAVDYSFEAGRPRVWEINTNPTAYDAASSVTATDSARYPVHSLFADRFAAALREIDSDDDVADARRAPPAAPCVTAKARRGAISVRRGVPARRRVSARGVADAPRASPARLWRRSKAAGLRALLLIAWRLRRPRADPR